MKIFGGLEGGASISKFALIDENGVVLAVVSDGPSTNHLLVGVEECQNRIYSMITKAIKKAKLDNNNNNNNSEVILDSLGLCMSGCEEEEANQKFKEAFMKRFPKVAKSCTVASDTIGSILTASSKGGIVLIAGTGSNSLLYNPDGSTARCGGWGHLLGDYGSGYWISQRAIKAVIESEENFNPIEFDTKRTKEIIFSHFKISDNFGLLEPTYVKFNKSEFSSLCARLSEVAIKECDPLCCAIFSEAGVDLGKHVLALYPKASKELLQEEGGLKIICVGSIFKSWKLLERGFFSALNNRIQELTLLRLTNSSAIGAAFLSAKSINYNLIINFRENYEILCHYKSGKLLTVH